MSRIKNVFDGLKSSGRKGLVPFITAGDPDPRDTVKLMHGLVEAGADVIELGIPFSDPMADGPVIQRASERALSKGVSLTTSLEMVGEFRKSNQSTPIVLMGYANPIERMGIGSFAQSAKNAGVDGVLVVDYPPEESIDFAKELRAHDLDPIFLLAPTSSVERINHVANLASGYIYYVSLKGVTGSANLDSAAVASVLPEIRKATDIPVAVGFGIRDAESAKRIAQTADAVVIGSRLVQILEGAEGDTGLQSLKQFVGDIRSALDELKIDKYQ
jgi:tryptophan synthase alpha chain